MLFKSKMIFQSELENFRPNLFKLAWSWCHNTDIADDLVQETCIKALKNRKQLQDIHKIRSWLMRILVNKHRDYLRTKKDLVELSSVDLIEQDDPATRLSRIDTIQQVRDAISQLNDNHRKIITLIDLTDFSYLEVADTLEIPVGTVMSRLNRARNNLKKILEESPSNISLFPNVRRHK